MDEEVRGFSAVTLLIVLVLVLLFVGCALVAWLFAADYLAQQGGPSIGPAPGEPVVESPPDGPAPGGSETPPDVSPADLERWDRITLDNVEDGCLRVAKAEAGESAALVYDCSCEETASAGRKTYGCEIDTADPFTEYFANIDCFLEDTACSVETNYGVLTLTFEEMDEWY